MEEENKTVRNASSSLSCSIERDDLSSDLKPSLLEVSSNLDDGYTLSMQLSKTQGAYKDTLHVMATPAGGKLGVLAS